MSQVRLMRAETLAHVAILTAPEPGILLSLAFSPDGRYLAGAMTNTVHLWDLRRLRRGLRDIGLDWDPSGPGDP
jgi:WD40 repeat protein